MLWRVIQTKVAKAKSDFMKQRINRNVYIWVRFWHQSQLPYFANKPITTALTGFGYDTTGGMWLSSYSGMNYYGYYDIDKRTIHARPANAEFGIYPLLTLVQN